MPCQDRFLVSISDTQCVKLRMVKWKLAQSELCGAEPRQDRRTGVMTDSLCECGSRSLAFGRLPQSRIRGTRKIERVIPTSSLFQLPQRATRNL